MKFVRRILDFSQDVGLNEVEAGKLFVHAGDQLWHDRPLLRRIGLGEDQAKELSHRAFTLFVTQRSNLLLALNKLAHVSSHDIQRIILIVTYDVDNHPLSLICSTFMLLYLVIALFPYHAIYRLLCTVLFI